MTLKGAEDVEFASTSGDEAGALTKTPWNLTRSDTNTDEDPLVSRDTPPVTIPIDLEVPSSGNKRDLTALLDMGCIK